MIYFMCTGRPPYRADSPMAVLNRICHEPHRPLDEVNPDVPIELAELVDRLLAKESADRFATAREVEARCAALLAEMQQGRRRRRGLAAAVAAKCAAGEAGGDWIGGGVGLHVRGRLGGLACVRAQRAAKRTARAGLAGGQGRSPIARLRTAGIRTRPARTGAAECDPFARTRRPRKLLMNRPTRSRKICSRRGNACKTSRVAIRVANRMRRMATNRGAMRSPSCTRQLLVLDPPADQTNSTEAFV